MKNSKVYLEHINITVNNLEEGLNFFITAFPHFKIRGRGEGRKNWVHFGDDNTYVALSEKIEESDNTPLNYDQIGIKHLGFVVENVDEIAKNLIKGGYKRDSEKMVEEFRIREYFLDSDGNEYEFIEYLSDLPSERNKYE